MSFFKSVVGPVLGGTAGFLIGGPAGAAVGAGLGGSVSSALGAQDMNRQNISLSREQMEFQERMSNTQYQRAMTDMKTAGLNPILAYKQGGAGTPSGSMAQVQNVGAAAAEGANKMSSSAIALATNKTMLEKIGLEKDLLKKQNKIAFENWMKAKMYNDEVMPTELASAKTGFHLNYLKNKNASLSEGLINKYKTPLFEKLDTSIEKGTKNFKDNFNSAWDHYKGAK